MSCGGDEYGRASLQGSRSLSCSHDVVACADGVSKVQLEAGV